jgi:hypothetical protein
MRARHGNPRLPPAATSWSPWTGHPGALTLSLSRAAAPHPHPPAVLLTPASNFQYSSCTPPPPSPSSPAAHHPPVGSPHQTTSAPANARTSFPVTCSCSTTP